MVVRGIFRAFLLLAAVAAGPWAAVGAAEPGTVGEKLEPALRSASRSIVCVRVRFAQRGAPVRVSPQEVTFCNTGFVVGPGGEVLTSLLALAGCDEITVITPDGRQASAELVAMDQPSGLALLKTGLGECTPPQFADSPPEPESWIVLASLRCSGSSETEQERMMVVPGVARACDGCVRVQGVRWDGLISASLNACAGSAAAPIFDARGRVAGVVLAVGLGRKTGQTECFALPSASLRPILDRLMAGQSRRSGWLGVAVTAEPEGREGVRVRAVIERSPAQQAGLLPGDLLLQIGERVIDSPDVLAAEVVETGPGRTVALRVLREDRLLTLPAQTGVRPVLIAPGAQRPGGRIVRIRWRRTVGALQLWPAARPESDMIVQLLDENRRLNLRVRELEEQLRRLQHAR